MLAVYANALPAGYVFDDPFYLQIVSGPRTAVDLIGFFARPVRLDPMLAPVETQVYRPIYYVYGAVAYRLWGARPWAWHAANIALHAMTACLVLTALRRFFGLPPAAALLTSLIWAVHPVHVQAVTWVSAVAYLQMGFFLMVAVLVAAGSWPRTWPWPARALVAAGAFALSVLNHELGIMAPALAGLALAGAPALGRAWGHPLDRGALAATGTMGATALVYLVLRLTFVSAGQAGGLEQVVGKFGPRILEAPEILLRYLALLAFPSRLTIDRSHDVPLPSGLLDPRLLLGLGLCAVMIWSVARAARRLPPLAFGAAWFLLAYLPISNTLIPLYSVMGEQYLYIASLGMVAGAVATIWATALAREMPRTAALLGIAILIAFGARSIVRNQDWRDDLTFNLATVAASPRSAVFHNNLGNSHFNRGELGLAEKEYRMALELNPAYPKAHYNLGTLAMSLGRLEEAEASYRRAIALRPDYFSPYYNLALVAHLRGRTHEEIVWLEQALALRPGHADAHLNLGVAYLAIDPERAAKHLRRFLALAPEDPQAAAVRARLLSLPPAAGR